MPTLADTMKKLADMYGEHVEKVDAAGYADMLKYCAEQFMENISGEMFLEDLPALHFKDVAYLDGYFLFGTGTNSVVHFHIEECPGWKFGIWWNVPEEPEKTRIEGEFFAQYEDAIDKFKPSASALCEHIHIDQDPKCNDLWGAARMLRFIIKEPSLAFCRDACYWDYNYEYHSREEADEQFKEFTDRKAKEAALTPVLDKKVIDFVRERIAPLFTDADIRFREHCIPRYELVAPFEKNRDIVDKPGCYGWFADGDEDGQETMAELTKLIEGCDKTAEENGIYWSRPIDFYVLFKEGK